MKKERYGKANAGHAKSGSVAPLAQGVQKRITGANG
jgi:hypothetical protein